MSEGQIQIDVEFSGTQEAVSSLGRVEQGVREVGTSATAGGASMQALGTSFSTTAQRVQGMSGAVQGLVSALGSRDRTAGLVASVAGATAQFAAMGSMLGPTGTVIGGITGLAVGLIGAARAADDTGDSMGEMGTRIATAEERVRDLNRALAELAMRSRIDMGVASMAEYNTEIAGAEERLEALNQAFERMDPALAGSTSERALTAEIRNVRNRLEELRGIRDAAAEEESAVMMESLGEAANAGAPTTRSGGGGRTRGRQGEDAGLRDVLSNEIGGNRAQVDMEEAMRHFAEAELEIEEDTNANLIAMREERYRSLAEKAEEAAQLEIDVAKRQYDELARLGEEEEARRAEADERALEQRTEVAQEMTGMLGNMTMAFGKSLAAIATGEKTADEAFKGLLKSFLEMISQYATLKAATEFADAGASFARYDYAGGAGHIAAGVAFTAVAVATGVGAGALGAAPSAPARPESSGAAESSKRGGDVIVNWNSPVVTAGTKAELGREIGVMLGEAAAL